MNDEELTDEEIVIEEETDEWETIEEPIDKKTEITVPEPKDKTDRGKCPYCGGSNIGKDPKKKVYVCFTCKKTYVWDE